MLGPTLAMPGHPNKLGETCAPVVFAFSVVSNAFSNALKPSPVQNPRLFQAAAAMALCSVVPEPASERLSSAWSVPSAAEEGSKWSGTKSGVEIVEKNHGNPPENSGLAMVKINEQNLMGK